MEYAEIEEWKARRQIRGYGRFPRASVGIEPRGTLAAEPLDDLRPFLPIDAALRFVRGSIGRKDPGEMCVYGQLESGVELVKAAGLCFEDQTAFALAEW